MRISSGLFVTALALGTAAPPAHAQDPLATDRGAKTCVSISNAEQRLACYDRAMNVIPAIATPASEALPTGQTLMRQDRIQTASTAEQRCTRRGVEEEHGDSLLDRRWELDTKCGQWSLRPYKPVYVLPAFYSNNVNRLPSSPSDDNQLSAPLSIDNVELKYQLSFKAKPWENILGSNADLWLAMTQVSHWQVYSGDNSRPFRETNYEPEAMVVLPLRYDMIGGWRWRMAGIGVNHQSNGRSDPLSRSWNRVILDLGFENEAWTLMLRPWVRIGESRDDDDNPDISDYLGHFDVQLVRTLENHEFALTGRSATSGGRTRGAVQFDWSFPFPFLPKGDEYRGILGDLRGYLQVFNGYGESLIDYNHSGWYVGAGFSLVQWY
ncbi:MAG: phospholipase A [Dokdonella sp.]